MAFLVFEGIDGSGKSTLIDLFCNKLNEHKLPFIKTKEPGGTKIGKKIRRLLLEKTNTKLSPMTETLLYYADRKQNIEEVIKPNLKKNITVISDRYWASTSAYQYGGRKISENFITALRHQICKDYEPDLWILLDIPIEITLKRLFISKANKRDRMEMENSSFHQKVRDYYLSLAKKNPEKWLILKGEKKSSILLEELISHLKSKKILF
ncbi:MAG: dTMP kinase [Bdellovibrionaceae bacterium]|nr:dTMP kinase [Pseudobdellovibrionaceae bacterium]